MATPPQPSAREDAKPAYQDCTACRLTGAAVFTGLGGYALVEAGRQGAFAKVRPRGKPMFAANVTAVIGVAFVGLGIGRLFV